MNYEKHYNLLIERAKHRVIDEYTERHHVIPRCMGGDDSASNLVRLTAEEHFLAHQLLVKMYPANRSLIHAATMMTTHDSDRRMNNKLFGWIRRKLSDSMSGDNNPNRRNPNIQKEAAKKRVGQKRTQETRKNISDALLGVPFTDEHLANLRKAAPNRKKPLDNRPVFAYEENGAFIGEFSSVYVCEKELAISRDMIFGVAEGKHQHVSRKRFFWKFKGDTIPPLEVIYKSRGVAKTKSHIDNQKQTLAKRHTCEHCGFVSSKSAINRHHNDFCPKNPNRKEKPSAKITTHTCPTCGHEGKGTVMFRHHFDKCKYKKENL